MSNTYLGDHKKGEIEIIKENLIFKNEYCEFYNDDVVFPSGIKGKYLRFKWSQDYGVMIFPKTKDGKILLIKNFRHEKRCWSWDIPKGFGINEISPLDCAKKGLSEETGYYTDNWSLFKIILEGHSNVHVYEAIIDPNIYKKENYDNGEAISDKRFFSKNELKDLLKSDLINDPMTLAFILKEMNN